MEMVMEVIKRQGKVGELAGAFASIQLKDTGIGHTPLATHGSQPAQCLIPHPGGNGQHCS